MEKSKRDLDTDVCGPPLKILKTDSQNGKDAFHNWEEVHEHLEESLLRKCLCEFPFEEIVRHLNVIFVNEQQTNIQCDQRYLLTVNFLSLIGTLFHDNLSSGMVCSTIQNLVNHVLQDTSYLDALLKFTKSEDAYLRYSSSQAISSLLPLGFCGQDIALPVSEQFIQKVISELKLTSSSTERASLSPGLPFTLSDVPDLHHNILPGLGVLPGLDVVPSVDHDQGSSLDFVRTDLTDSELENQSWLIRILHDFIAHGSKQTDEPTSEKTFNNCNIAELEDEMLCQEIQVKCCLIKQLEPAWENLTRTVADVASKFNPPLSTSSSLMREKSAGTRLDGHVFGDFSNGGGDNKPDADARKVRLPPDGGEQVGRTVYTVEAFRLWRALISVRANLNFVESRNFSANLSLPVHQLQKETPSLIWKEVLDTVSECLCYGSTLGLQSIPPEEPCQLAHTLIRLIRFEGFLSRVPHAKSTGFGGGSSGELDGDDLADTDVDRHDKGLVQKVVLIVLKCVALTTRESRVDSSSGESDSSLSSHESASSCTSDLVIIERNMTGVYKQVDRWIKTILPILPDTSLQDNILNLLQEQDDVLIEGLLCLLDTHIALQHPNRDTHQGLSDNCPTAGFIKFLSLVGGDSSVLLDFLVSNETCFLLYLLRYLKYIIKDWSKFVTSCGSSYSSTVEVILQLKSSIQRLLTKDLFPYNIAPVYKLLERVDNLVEQNK